MLIDGNDVQKPFERGVVIINRHRTDLGVFGQGE